MKKKNKGTPTEDVTASKKEKREAASGGSLIGYLLDKLSCAIYNALVGGLFGYIFSSYYSELSAYHNGFIFHNFKSGSKLRRVLRSIRGYLSRSFETSFALRKLRRGVCGLADVSAKTYGRFAFSFGIYTLLFYFIKLLVPTLGVANTDNLYIGIIICIVSIPLFTSDGSLAEIAFTSRITKFIFSDAFGYRDEAFEHKNPTNRRSSSAKPMFLGLTLGVLTFFINPMIIIGLIAIFVAVSLIVISPEIGVLLSLLGLPFFSLVEYPAILLTVITLITTVSYCIKLIRGKRVIRFEIIDFAVVTFIAILYFSGRITVGGYSSYLSALIACYMMLGYFLVANLVRTWKWLHRCIYALVISGTITAAIGVLQYALGFAVNDWLDVDYFGNIYGRATATFDNPNYLAAYLAIVFPFALYLFTRVKGIRSKLLSAISCILIVFCTVFTWCRAAWIAMIACFIIYLVIITRKSFKYFLAVFAATPLAAFLVPDNVLQRFLSIGNLADSSTLYRVYTWRSCMELASDYLWGGIGYGQSAFERIYPQYAYAGIEAAVHSHNLYLQIVITTGIGGIICFALVAFFFAQNCLSYVNSPYDRSSSLITSASLMSVISMLIMGLFDFVWYNNSVFFMFWVALALGVACTRVGTRELARDGCICNTDDNAASVNLYL